MNFFREIFNQEHQFALEQLFRQRSPKSNSQYQQQLVNNIQVFKDNLVIIVKDIIENLWLEK